MCHCNAAGRGLPDKERPSRPCGTAEIWAKKPPGAVPFACGEGPGVSPEIQNEGEAPPGAKRSFGKSRDTAFREASRIRSEGLDARRAETASPAARGRGHKAFAQNIEKTSGDVAAIWGVNYNEKAYQFLGFYNLEVYHPEAGNQVVAIVEPEGGQVTLPEMAGFPLWCHGETFARRAPGRRLAISSR